MSDAKISEFDRATALRRRQPGVHDALLDEGWAVGHAVNGGYLLSILARALGADLPHPDPFTISAHYLTASLPGPATVRTELARAGRTLATGSASLWQTDDTGTEVERVRVLATYGELDQLTEDVRTSAKPPHFPPPQECFSPRDNPAGSAANPAMTDRLDLRLDSATVGWALGEPSGSGEMRAWFSFADGRDADALSLLTTVDALPPAAFELGVTGWLPTVELTAHVRARPAPGPLRVALSTRNMAGGFLEEDCEVWDSEDRLVAQARQLARPR
ncbi:thioesterase family protein [Streptomyces oceani]|uniref:TesB-like acyl-CoA thioesterase 3 n=1 Tax=Streptomyces oceani TaxID=1075402 RepID=A0A1E7KNQ4_9ACTN|nr:thioesterase family protein [Streptomyces oceani]OEV05550.1 TesB-like acyl-CoA thioesterase 3 [Streptomyces oceani]